MDGHPRKPVSETVLIAFASPADEGVSSFLAGYSGVRIEDGPPLKGDALAARAAECEILVTRAYQAIDRGVLEAGRRGRLKAVVQGSAGLDNIDHQAALDLGIEILPTDPGNATAVAELTLMSMVALARRARDYWHETARGVWPGNRDSLQDSELAGKRLGLVGLGRVGTRVARRARTFEMEVLAVDPYLDSAIFDRFEAHRVDRLEQLLERVDMLSLHCPLTDETRGMMGGSRLRLLPRGALLINTARGGLLDERALVTLLDEGHLAGAALDVFSSEPPPFPGVANHPKILPTPHIGGHTRESHQARARFLAQGLKELLDRWGVS